MGESAPLGPLAGKVALVTAGSRGIGAAIATRLAREGADVAITYISNEAAADQLVAAVTALGRRALSVRADSADVAAVRAAVRQTHATLGGLDILVNCAGIMVPGLLDAYGEADFERIFNVNVRGGFFAVQAALAFMGQGGRIINVGSIITKSYSPAIRGGVPYAMTKGAVATMTKGMARELGERGITVNLIVPGPTKTEATDKLPPEFRARSLANCAIQEFSLPEEIAGLAVFIASPEARHITGAEFVADSGMGL